jgi:hypothetical protein
MQIYQEENTVGWRPTRPTNGLFGCFCWTAIVGRLKIVNPTRPTASNKTTVM